MTAWSMGDERRDAVDSVPGKYGRGKILRVAQNDTKETRTSHRRPPREAEAGNDSWSVLKFRPPKESTKLFNWRNSPMYNGERVQSEGLFTKPPLSLVHLLGTFLCTGKVPPTAGAPNSGCAMRAATMENENDHKKWTVAVYFATAHFY